MTELEQRLQQTLVQEFADATSVVVQCQGNHCSVSVTSPSFAGQKLLQKQQRVNACVKSFIASGEVHALQIQTQES